MKVQMFAPLLFTASLALADEVRLNDGTIYKDCVVESETAENVTIIVPVSKTIKDTKTIPVADISLIIKSTPDERAFADLSRKYGDVKGLSGDDLKKGVELVEKFVSDNPKSKVLDKAKELEGALKAASEAGEKEEAKEEEKQAVSPEIMKKEGYDIDSNKLLVKFQATLKQGNVIPAMLFFDQLSQNYGASEAYKKARKSADKILPQLVKNLSAMLKAAESKEQEIYKEETRKTTEINAKRRQAKTEEQKAAASKMDEEWREQLDKTRQARLALKSKYREEIQKVREKKMRWFNPVPDLPDSIRDLERVAQDDLERVKRELKDVEFDKAGKGSQALKTAWEALDKGELELAANAVAEIRSLRVPREYWEQLELDLKDAKTAAYEKERADREAARAQEMEERRKKQEARNKERLDELNKKANKLKEAGNPSSKKDAPAATGK